MPTPNNPAPEREKRWLMRDWTWKAWIAWAVLVSLLVYYGYRLVLFAHILVEPHDPNRLPLILDRRIWYLLGLIFVIKTVEAVFAALTRTKEPTR